MIRQNEHCRVWEGEDSRLREFTMGAHWGCPVMWLSIRDRMPPADGRAAREGNGLTLTRYQALEVAWILETYGRTGELPETLTREKRAEWLEVLKGEPLTVAEGGDAAIRVVDGGLD